MTYLAFFDRFHAVVITTIGTLLAFCNVAQAVDNPAEPIIPPVVQAGFDAYASKGPDAAVTAWSKGSYFEGEKVMKAGGAAFLSNEQYFGKYESFELIATKTVGTRVKLVFLEMNFNKGAMFACFQLYKRDKRWIIQDITWKYKPEEIMPWLLTAEKKY
jgi:hypothetical protein